MKRKRNWKKTIFLALALIVTLTIGGACTHIVTHEAKAVNANENRTGINWLGQYYTTPATPPDTPGTQTIDMDIGANNGYISFNVAWNQPRTDPGLVIFLNNNYEIGNISGTVSGITYILHFVWYEKTPTGTYNFSESARDEVGLRIKNPFGNIEFENGGIPAPVEPNEQYYIVETSSSTEQGQNIDAIVLTGYQKEKKYCCRGELWVLPTASDNTTYMDAYIATALSRWSGGSSEYWYNLGRTEGAEAAKQYTFTGLMTSVVDAPLQVFTDILDFEILGMNVAQFVISILSILIIVKIISLFAKGGG